MILPHLIYSENEIISPHLIYSENKLILPLLIFSENKKIILPHDVFYQLLALVLSLYCPHSIYCAHCAILPLSFYQYSANHKKGTYLAFTFYKKIMRLTVQVELKSQNGVEAAIAFYVKPPKTPLMCTISNLLKWYILPVGDNVSAFSCHTT